MSYSVHRINMYLKNTQHNAIKTHNDLVVSCILCTIASRIVIVRKIIFHKQHTQCKNKPYSIQPSGACRSLLRR